MERVINNMSVDCVIFGFHNNSLKVLLTERKLIDKTTGETIVDDYTLQGHHVLEGENLEDAAARVLKDKTGLENIFLKQFYTFGDANRIQNKKDQLWTRVQYPNIEGQVFSVGYYSLVDSSKVNPDRNHRYTRWFPINSLPELGYDHHKIIIKALGYMRCEIRREPICFELLPEKFTLTQLQRLYEAILGIKLDKRNFRKKIAQMKYVISLNEKQNGVAHKPAQIFFYSKEVYEKTKKDKLEFSF